MTKILSSLALAALMAGFMTSGGLSTAPAQEKKAKDAKKELKSAAKSMTGTIEINEGKDDKFRFFVRDADGKLLAMSGPGGFEKREDAEKAVEALKQVLSTAKIAPAKK